jgi:hypothetical protein
MSQFIEKSIKILQKLNKNHNSIIIILESFIILLVLFVSLLIYLFINATQGNPPLS